MSAKILATLLLPALALVSAPSLAGPSKPTHGSGQAPQAKAAGGSTIIGSQEMPKGLVIMPWHSAVPESSKPRPTRLLDEPQAPLNPRAFKQRVQYYQARHAGGKK